MVTWLSTESKNQDGSTLQTRQKLREPSTHTHAQTHTPLLFTSGKPGLGRLVDGGVGGVMFWAFLFVRSHFLGTGPSSEPHQLTKCLIKTKIPGAHLQPTGSLLAGGKATEEALQALPKCTGV